jgi:tetratricopeptide (TPR) repeat protein
MKERRPDFVEQPSAQDYARAARAAIVAEDWRLALEQSGAALTFNPESEEYLGLLDDALAGVHNPLAFLDLKDDAFFGLVAVKAWALNRAGKLDEALETLLEVVLFRPGIPYLSWIPLWLRAGRPVSRTTLERVWPLLREFFELVRGTTTKSTLFPNVSGAGALLQEFRAKSIEPVPVTLLHSALLRACGRSVEALTLVRAAADRWKSSLVFVELANIAEELGDETQRREALHRAAELNRT